MRNICFGSLILFASLSCTTSKKVPRDISSSLSLKNYCSNKEEWIAKFDKKNIISTDNQFIAHNRQMDWSRPEINFAKKPLTIHVKKPLYMKYNDIFNMVPSNIGMSTSITTARCEVRVVPGTMQVRASTMYQDEGKISIGSNYLVDRISFENHDKDTQWFQMEGILLDVSLVPVDSTNKELPDLLLECEGSYSTNRAPDGPRMANDYLIILDELFGVCVAPTRDRPNKADSFRKKS